MNGLFFMFIFLSCNKKENTTTLPARPDIKSQIAKLNFVSSIESEEITDIATGVKRYKYRLLFQNDPVTLYITEVDLTKPGLGFQVLTPNDASTYMLQTVKEMAEKSDKQGNRVITATNGDYFSGNGRPWGALIKNGQIIKTDFFDTWHGFFGVKKDGELFMGAKGNLARDSASFSMAIGGTERLINNFSRAFHSTNAGRHPRTVVAYNDRKQGFLIVADGRIPGHSVGMSLAELSELLFALRIKEALNLDGGGSTTLVDKDLSKGGFSIANKHSDAAPRAVANALAIVDVSGK